MCGWSEEASIQQPPFLVGAIDGLGSSLGERIAGPADAFDAGEENR